MVDPKSFVTTVAIGVLSVTFTAAGVSAAEAPTAPSEGVAAASARVLLSVSMLRDGVESTYLTRARTVAEFLDEQNMIVAADDYLSAGKDDLLVDGMRLVYRPAVDVRVTVDGKTEIIRTTGATIREVLQSQNIALAPQDEVKPGLDERPLPDEDVHVVRVKTWTRELRESIPAPTKRRFDLALAAGSAKTLRPGSRGERVIEFRFVQRDQSVPARTILAARILREPKARVIVQGVSQYAALASYAERGFQSALHFAGAALHVIATAYTGACLGCSGVTASGAPAGHGVVAVDPSVIPLGTKLYVPGYGRAIAGDTGGAIRGHRIDLGFDSLGEALRFGRRAITVYVLR